MDATSPQPQSDFDRQVQAVASVLALAAPYAAPVPLLAGALAFTPALAKFVIAGHNMLMSAKPKEMTADEWLALLASDTVHTSPDEMYLRAKARAGK